jgi:hypothetical protein
MQLNFIYGKLKVHLIINNEGLQSLTKKEDNNKIKGEMDNPSMGTVLLQIELRCPARELSGSKKHG